MALVCANAAPDKHSVLKGSLHGPTSETLKLHRKLLQVKNELPGLQNELLCSRVASKIPG
jgi:hypothetical protein